MKFAIMGWSGANVLDATIFAAVDADGTSKQELPPITNRRGHWQDVKTIDESRCPFAEEAKKAIASDGYFIFGGDIISSEIEAG